MLSLLWVNAVTPSEYTCSQPAVEGRQLTPETPLLPHEVSQYFAKFTFVWFTGIEVYGHESVAAVQVGLKSLKDAEGAEQEAEVYPQ